MEQEPTQKTTEPTQNQGTTESSTTTNSSTSTNSTNNVFIAVVVLLVLAGGAYFAWDSGMFNSEQAGVTNPFATEQSDTTQKEYPEVIANVNGEEVPKDPLLQSITQTQSLAAQQGANPDDPVVQEEIETQALEIVINTVLLIQAAEEAQITVSPEDIDAELAQLQTQFGSLELLQAELDRIGMTEEDLRADLQEQLLINAYIEANVDDAEIAVTDAEIEAMYTTLAQQNEQLPALTDIQEQLREQLASQKQQEAVGLLLEALKADATVEIFI